MTALEADEMLMLEIAENEQRKEFTVSEKLAFAEKLKAVEAEKAKQRRFASPAILWWPIGHHKRSMPRLESTRHCCPEGGLYQHHADAPGTGCIRKPPRPDGAGGQRRKEHLRRVQRYAARDDRSEKPKTDDGVLAGLIQEKPVEVPEFDVYRPALEPAPGNVRTVKGADHEHLLENPIYSRLYDSYNEAVQQANLVRGEMRTRCVGYERRIRGYEENIQTMRRTIENLRTENERLHAQLGGAAHA